MRSIESIFIWLHSKWVILVKMSGPLNHFYVPQQFNIRWCAKFAMSLHVKSHKCSIIRKCGSNNSNHTFIIHNLAPSLWPYYWVFHLISTDRTKYSSLSKLAIIYTKINFLSWTTLRMLIKCNPCIQLILRLYFHTCWSTRKVYYCIPHENWHASVLLLWL